MKIRKSLLLCVAAMSLGGLAGCKNKNNEPTQPDTVDPSQDQDPQPVVVHVESLEITPTSLSLVEGQESSITATVLPENATDKSVTFSSSDATIASVTAAGVVKGLKKGVAIITVQSVDNPSKFKVCAVQVSEAPSTDIPVEAIIVGETNLTLEPSEEKVQLSATVSPANATNKALVWSSTNPDVVSVEQDGKIQAKAVGSAAVIVKSVENPSISQTFVITVKEHVERVTRVSLSQTALGLEENASPVQLVATVAPENADNKGVYWTSSNTAVATVDPDGTVTPVKKGAADITVTTIDGGHTAVCHVTVTRTDLTGIALNETSISFDSTDVGAEKQLEATLTPSDATYKEITWSSSDVDVATVTSTGLVKMVGQGTCVITALHTQSLLTATCTVTVTVPSEYKVGMPIKQSLSYQTYLSNIQPNDYKLGEFVDRDELYEVGDDNKLSFKPDLKVMNKDNDPVDSSVWTYPYVITVEKKNGDVFEEAPASHYSVVSYVTAELDFADAAVGGTYRVSVRVGGFTDKQLEEFEGDLSPITAVYTVKVVDGYNVTSEIELAYLDSAVDNSYEMGSGEDEFYPNFPAFKTAHGLENGYFPKNLVMHKDLSISPEHIPSEFIVSDQDAIDGNWDAAERVKSVGSLKDYTYLYSKWNSGETILSGNYFTLDWSRIPLIKRTGGKSTTVLSKTESHSSFLRAYSGTVDIKNVNFIGNAHTASSEDDVYLAGGLIGFKSTWANQAVRTTNVLGHGCYITFFAESAWSTLPNHEVALYSIKDCKFYDNYNCFIYNWGGKVVAENTKFEGCGGPIVIQDHWDNPDQEFFHFNLNLGEYTYSFEQSGYVPETTFIDCELDNYVLGSEAWFQSFGAAAVTAQIKQMGDLLMGVKPGRTMVFNEEHVGSTYAELSAQSKDSLFNFIVLNKSAHIEGMSAEQVNGSVKFLHRDGAELNVVDHFHYNTPVPTDAEHPAELANLAGAGLFAQFEQAAGAGAPIFETAGGLGMYPGEGTTLYDVSQLPSYAAVGTSLVDSANDHLALYYNGMMLVMGLGYYGA